MLLDFCSGLEGMECCSCCCANTGEAIAIGVADVADWSADTEVEETTGATGLIKVSVRLGSVADEDDDADDGMERSELGPNERNENCSASSVINSRMSARAILTSFLQNELS